MLYVRVDGKLVATAGFPRMDPARGTGEYGILVAAEHQRRGLCALAVLLGLTYGFETLQLREILFSTLAANTAMRAFLERIGVPLRSVGADWHATAHNYVLEAAHWPAVKARLASVAPGGDTPAVVSTVWASDSS